MGGKEGGTNACARGGVMTLEILVERLEEATRELLVKAEMLWEELLWNKGGKK